MGEFKIAYQITGSNEGGYANNKSDKGGETLDGISRVYNPGFKGFAILDKVKAAVVKPGMDIHDRNVWKLINAEMKKYPEIKDLKAAFYKAGYWNTNQLDHINDQQICNSVYDYGVNSGTFRAADTLQDAYNNLRGSGTALKNDGEIGSKTIGAVNAFPPKMLLTEYNRLREVYYRKLAEEPSQKQFLSSWLTRLKPYKLILLFFASTALFMQIGCGTRKVNNESLKTSNSGKSINENKGSVKAEIAESSGASESTKNDKKNTVTTKTTTEKIDTSGRVTERIVQEQTQEKIDKTEKIKNKFKNLNHKIDSTFTNKVYKDTVFTATIHKKNIVADKSIAGNIKWYGILAGVLLLVFAGLYYIFRGRVAAWLKS